MVTENPAGDSRGDHSASVQTPFERACTVHLDGDKHETLLTERSGLFSVYCGCGWKAQDLRYEAAETAERAHWKAEQEAHSGTATAEPREYVMAPPFDRCCMGFPLGTELTCWNYAPGLDLWCPTCTADIAGTGPGCECPGCTAARAFGEAHSGESHA